MTTRPIGIDATAVMLMAAAAGVDARMLVSILPRIEAAIIHADEPSAQEGDANDDP